MELIRIDAMNCANSPGNQYEISAEETLLDRYLRLRQYTQTLIAPLNHEDMAVQSMPDASPVKWHLAHTTWFFETFLLATSLPGYPQFHPGFGYPFHSDYEAPAPRQPPSQPWPLTL